MASGAMKEKAQSYRDLVVYSLAKMLAVKIHSLTVNELPGFEMYEEGRQIRKSSKSIVANIVEGFGRRRHKNQFVQFLTYAVASCDETKAHLELLHETGSLEKGIFKDVLAEYEELGAKLYRFREAVVSGHLPS